jgi:hypothetical protein
MTFSHGFWKGHFDNQFSPQLRGLVDVLEFRVLPSFEHIAGEIQSHTDQLWTEFREFPGADDFDIDQIAEAIQDEGIRHYMLLDDLRQGIVNLFSASLYHAFEQQLLSFHRRELLHPTEASNPKQLKVETIRDRLIECGIDIQKFQSWPKMDELRLLANTVKHAEGASAKLLYKRRPEFFQPGQQMEPNESSSNLMPRVFLPLAGKDLFVEPKDIRSYLESAIAFWDELLAALAAL